MGDNEEVQLLERMLSEVTRQRNVALDQNAEFVCKLHIANEKIVELDKALNGSLELLAKEQGKNNKREEGE